MKGLVVFTGLASVSCIENGLARTPPMGWNSWMAIGWSITDAYVREVAGFLASSGLQAAGYTAINSDDGWSAHRGPDGHIVPDPTRWPYGLNNNNKRKFNITGIVGPLYYRTGAAVSSLTKGATRKH